MSVTATVVLLYFTFVFLCVSSLSFCVLHVCSLCLSQSTPAAVLDLHSCNACTCHEVILAFLSAIHLGSISFVVLKAIFIS